MVDNKKMKAKDYIACGILSLMNMVGMLAAAVMNISGYTTLLYGAVAAFFVGILYVIVSFKVPKPGAIIVFTIVPCLYFFVSGVIEGIIGAAGALIYALLAELVRKKDYLSMKMITISGIVYTLYMSTIGSAENFLFTDRYCDSALEHGINETVVEQMRQIYYIKPLWIAVIVGTAITTYLGILLGMTIMKKHLKKVGIV